MAEATATQESTAAEGGTPSTQSSPATETGKGGGTDTREQSIPRARFDEVNGQLHTLKQELDALRREKQQADDTKAAEQGQWQTLAEQRLSKIAELEPHKERADRLEQAMKAHAAALMEGLPEDTLDLLKEMDPEKQLAWLGKHRDRALASKGGTVRPGNTSGPAPAGPSGRQGYDRDKALEEARRHYPRPL